MSVRVPARNRIHLGDLNEQRLMMGVLKGTQEGY